MSTVIRKNQEYSEWVRIVTTEMAHLSKPQAVVLAMWSFGMVMTGSCGLSTVSVFLAALLGKKENTVRQQLKEWYKNKEGKKGNKRCQLDVSSCFAPLLKWILSLWSTDNKCLPLALDASTLGTRFTILMVSVVYRGCGIPVAWKIVEATAKGSWQPYWLKLLQDLDDVVPQDWLVVVSGERGLYAKWLYDGIVALGWHPFLRINPQGQFRPNGKSEFQSLNSVVTEIGQSWSGQVTCFKTNPLNCTLLARWDDGYKDPWLILTDLKPHQANACWYSMRSWIECLFQDGLRGGWKWHQTKMTDPSRAERHWLAIALATLWLISIGGEADANLSTCDLTSSSTETTTSITDSLQTPTRLRALFSSRFYFASSSGSESSSPTNGKPNSSVFWTTFFLLFCLNLKNLPLRGEYPTP